MGQLVEVVALEIEEVPSELLLGASVDTPAAGRRLSAHAVEIGGWALGREEAVSAVEVAHGGELLAQAEVGQPRSDIEDAYPDAEDAGNAGFEVEVEASRLPARTQLTVRVRIGGATVPVARLRLRRYWRGEWDERPPLVSVVVTRDTDDGDLEATMRGLEADRYPLTELVISDFDADGNPAAARNEAIRDSEGGLILFLPAGAKLESGTIAKGVGRLTAAAEACALIDAKPGGEVAAALYRRSAFEELTGFDEAAGAGCDRELGGRASEYDALFEPGSLRGGEG
jgi:hypothetical protein